MTAQNMRDAFDADLRVESRSWPACQRCNDLWRVYRAFTARLLVIAIIGALAVALWRLTDVLVLMFGAILLAIGLCAAAREPPR